MGEPLMFVAPSPIPLPLHASGRRGAGGATSPGLVFRGVHTRPSRRARATRLQVRASADSETPEERMNRDMRGYRAKLRKRLFDVFSSAEAVSAAELEAAVAAARTPEPGDTVESIGGAMLDSGVVGMNAGEEQFLREAVARNKQTAQPGTPMDTTNAQVEFARGIELFQRGMYHDAVKAFTASETSAGPQTRLGGQVALWRAQAVYALGSVKSRKEAAQLLDLLTKHDDVEVRKAAAEMKYILTAPTLPVEPGTFVEIPEFDSPEQDRPRYMLAQSGVGRAMRKKDEKPEKYSLEWYMEKERPPRNSNNSGLFDVGVLIFVVTFCIVFASSAFG